MIHARDRAPLFRFRPFLVARSRHDIGEHEQNTDLTWPKPSDRSGSCYPPQLLLLFMRLASRRSMARRLVDFFFLLAPEHRSILRNPRVGEGSMA